MNIIDVTTWNTDYNKQVSGTRKKYWIISPNGQQYLFKLPYERTGEIWAETIASKLGELIGIPIAKTVIGKRKQDLAMLTKNFTSNDEEFFEGGDLFFNIINDFDRYSLDHYNISNIMKILREFDLDKKFIFITFFDALIGNQDRHCDNWGIIVSENSYRLAPIYDNGASLGFNLDNDKVSKMLKDSRMFLAYTNRSTSMIGINNRRKPKTLDLLSVIKDYDPTEAQKAIEMLEIIDREAISDIVNSIPAEVMTDLLKEWVIELILYRKNWLKNWHDRRDSHG